MRYIREMTQKGDPRISVLLPKTLIAKLKELAKNNKRPYQDEFIKRITRTLRFPEGFAALERDHEKHLAAIYKFEDKCVSQLVQITATEKFIQALPREILDEIKAFAISQNRSLSQETALRLYLTITAPETFMLNDLVTKILNYKFSKEEINNEQEYTRRSKEYQSHLANNCTINKTKEA